MSSGRGQSTPAADAGPPPVERGGVGTPGTGMPQQDLCFMKKIAMVAAVDRCHRGKEPGG